MRVMGKSTKITLTMFVKTHSHDLITVHVPVVTHNKLKKQKC